MDTKPEKRLILANTLYDVYEHIRNSSYDDEAEILAIEKEDINKAYCQLQEWRKSGHKVDFINLLGEND